MKNFQPLDCGKLFANFKKNVHARFGDFHGAIINRYTLLKDIIFPAWRDAVASEKNLKSGWHDGGLFIMINDNY
jgi:hypothetical protein